VTVVLESVSPGAPVWVSLCRGGLEPHHCGRGEIAPATAERQQVRFSGLAPGRYAVAAFQDLNGNRMLDRSPVGVPVEPYGFSNGVGRTAPPRFDRAAVLVEGDVAVRVRLDLARQP